MADNPFRVMPRVTDLNRHFWEGGSDGKLHIQRCNECETWIHPAQPLCPECFSKNIEPVAVSGRASVATYTLNHHQWVPADDHPYVIAIVELEEDPRVRLTTNIVNCPAEDVHIDMQVQVCFQQYESVFIPVFEPVSGGVA